MVLAVCEDRGAKTVRAIDIEDMPERVEAMIVPDNKKPWTENLPFPKRWLGYIAIKLIVLVLGVYLALRWKGML